MNMASHPSPASASSSTLIVTPLPLNHKHKHDSIHTRRSKPKGPLNLDLTLSPGAGYGYGGTPLPDRMSGKGFIEPSRSNLPRRRRGGTGTPATATATAGVKSAGMGETPPATPIPVSSPNTHTVTHDDPPPQTEQLQSSMTASAGSATPDPYSNTTEPSTPPRPEPISTLNYPLQVAFTPRTPFHPSTPTKGHLQPTKGNLPRRAAHRSLSRRRDASAPKVGDMLGARTEEEMRVVKREREERRCVQDLGRGVGVAFLDEEDEGGDEGEERVALVLQVFCATEECAEEMIVTIPCEAVLQDGISALSDVQIREACAFIYDRVADAQDPAVRVLVCSPLTRPEEAMSVASAYLAAFLPSSASTSCISSSLGSAPSPSSQPVPEFAPATPAPVENQEDQQEDKDDNLWTASEPWSEEQYSAVHRLIMKWHDEPLTPSPLPFSSSSADSSSAATTSTLPVNTNGPSPITAPITTPAPAPATSPEQTKRGRKHARSHLPLPITNTATQNRNADSLSSDPEHGEIRKRSEDKEDKEEDKEEELTGRFATIAVGLREEWRGVLREDGIGRLDGVWAPSSPSLGEEVGVE
ncbi:hypothetical protein B0H34DRAFT_701857 [Crassisporium funariophilum]|nr:hypothetical protein B0H34DRAFT_701857 [Crassisporium funariophilum]